MPGLNLQTRARISSSRGRGWRHPAAAFVCLGGFSVLSDALQGFVSTSRSVGFGLRPSPPADGGSHGHLVSRRASEREQLLARVLDIEDSDAATDWVMKRRFVCECGEKNPMKVSTESLKSFLDDYDAGSIQKPELCSLDLVGELDALRLADPEIATAWWNYCSINPGDHDLRGEGTGTRDPSKLPHEFVKKFVEHFK